MLPGWNQQQQQWQHWPHCLLLLPPKLQVRPVL
jgi:hypothetical protein